MIHSHLTWLKEQKTCPHCWSHIVNFDTDVSGVIYIECGFCDWKLTVNRQQLDEMNIVETNPQEYVEPDIDDIPF